MSDTLNIWAPRVIGWLAAWLCAWATEKLNLTLDQVQITALMLGIYTFLHRAISKKLNPGDAAKSLIVNNDKATIYNNIVES